MFIKFKLQTLWIFHHLQYIISSKQSENLATSVCRIHSRKYMFSVPVNTLFEIMYVASSRIKRSAQFKSLYFWWCGGAVVSFLWNNFQRHRQHWKVFTGFRARVLFQDILYIFQWKLPLLQQHGFVIERASLQSGPLTNWKHLEHQDNMSKKTQVCWAARILYQTRMKQHSSLKGPATGLISSQMFITVVKRKGDATQR